MKEQLETFSLPGCAEVVGSPGTGARNWGVWQLLAPGWVLVLLIGFVAGSALQPAFVQGGVAGVMLLLLISILAVLVQRGGEKLVRHLRGARGEEIVACHLAALPEGWTVFHSLPLSGSDSGGRDADHVVVGPHGVFVVETKYWDGKLDVVNGGIRSGGKLLPYEEPFGRTAELAREVMEGIRDEAGVRVDVYPLVCFVGASLVRGAGEKDGVAYLEVRELLSHLRASGEEGQSDALMQTVRDALARWMSEEKDA